VQYLPRFVQFNSCFKLTELLYAKDFNILLYTPFLSIKILLARNVYLDCAFVNLSCATTIYVQMLERERVFLEKWYTCLLKNNSLPMFQKRRSVLQQNVSVRYEAIHHEFTLYNLFPRLQGCRYQSVLDVEGATMQHLKSGCRKR